MILRVLNYNIHKGRAFVSRKKTWAHILDLLLNTRPDVIFLQEFLREKEALSLLQRLAELLWPYHAFGQTASWNGSEYGNALLSRFPLKKIYNTDISNSSYERRGLLYGLIYPKPDRPLHLFCCHLDLTHRGRLKQLEKMRIIISEMAPKKSSILLAGDFNDWQEQLHPEIERFFHVQEAFFQLNGKLLLSSPSLYPLFSLDRIYFRGVTPLAGRQIVTTHWRHRSDHLPLYVDFEI
jgi:endonuclease/exonuclease/phosphatase family metal-dependent hydrolase